MLEGVVEQYLLKYVGHYILGLDRQNLSVATWKGEIHLKNCRLKQEAVEVLNLPFQLLYGEVGDLKINVPWNLLGSRPVVVELRRLFLLLALKDVGDWSEEEERRRVQLHRKRMIDRADVLCELQFGMDAPAEDQSQGFLSRLFTRISDNLEVHLHDVHIRFEDTVPGDQGTPFCMGTHLARLEAQTASEVANGDWVPTFIDRSREGRRQLFKLLTLKDLSAYHVPSSWARATAAAAAGGAEQLRQRFGCQGKDWRTTFQEQQQLHRMAHILPPVSGRLKLTQSFNTSDRDTPRFVLDCHLQDIRVTLTPESYQALFAITELVSEYFAFQEVIRHRMARYWPLRPQVRVQGHVLQWWGYLRRCIKLSSRAPAPEQKDQAITSFAALVSDENLARLRKQARYCHLVRRWKLGVLDEQEVELMQALETSQLLSDIIRWRSMTLRAIQQEVSQVQEATAGERRGWGLSWLLAGSSSSVARQSAAPPATPSSSSEVREISSSSTLMATPLSAFPEAVSDLTGMPGQREPSGSEVGSGINKFDDVSFISFRSFNHQSSMGPHLSMLSDDSEADSDIRSLRRRRPDLLPSVGTWLRARPFDEDLASLLREFPRTPSSPSRPRSSSPRACHTIDSIAHAGPCTSAATSPGGPAASAGPAASGSQEAHSPPPPRRPVRHLGGQERAVTSRPASPSFSHTPSVGSWLQGRPPGLQTTPGEVERQNPPRHIGTCEAAEAFCGPSVGIPEGPGDTEPFDGFRFLPSVGSWLQVRLDEDAQEPRAAPAAAEKQRAADGRGVWQVLSSISVSSLFSRGGVAPPQAPEVLELEPKPKAPPEAEPTDSGAVAAASSSGWGAWRVFRRREAVKDAAVAAVQEEPPGLGQESSTGQEPAEEPAAGAEALAEPPAAAAAAERSAAEEEQPAPSRGTWLGGLASWFYTPRPGDVAGGHADPAAADAAGVVWRSPPEALADQDAGASPRRRVQVGELGAPEAAAGVPRAQSPQLPPAALAEDRGGEQSPQTGRRAWGFAWFGSVHEEQQSPPMDLVDLASPQNAEDGGPPGPFPGGPTPGPGALGTSGRGEGQQPLLKLSVKLPGVVVELQTQELLQTVGSARDVQLLVVAGEEVTAKVGVAELGLASVRSVGKPSQRTATETKLIYLDAPRGQSFSSQSHPREDGMAAAATAAASSAGRDADDFRSAMLLLKYSSSDAEGHPFVQVHGRQLVVFCQQELFAEVTRFLSDLGRQVGGVPSGLDRWRQQAKAVLYSRGRPRVFMQLSNPAIVLPTKPLRLAEVLAETPVLVLCPSTLGAESEEKSVEGTSTSSENVVVRKDSWTASLQGVRLSHYPSFEAFQARRDGGQGLVKEGFAIKVQCLLQKHQSRQMRSVFGLREPEATTVTVDIQGGASEGELPELLIALTLPAYDALIRAVRLLIRGPVKEEVRTSDGEVVDRPVPPTRELSTDEDEDVALLRQHSKESFVDVPASPNMDEDVLTPPPPLSRLVSGQSGSATSREAANPRRFIRSRGLSQQALGLEPTAACQGKPTLALPSVAVKLHFRVLAIGFHCLPEPQECVALHTEDTDLTFESHADHTTIAFRFRSLKLGQPFLHEDVKEHCLLHAESEQGKEPVALRICMASGQQARRLHAQGAETFVDIGMGAARVVFSPMPVREFMSFAKSTPPSEPLTGEELLKAAMAAPLPREVPLYRIRWCFGEATLSWIDQVTGDYFAESTMQQSSIELNLLAETIYFRGSFRNFTISDRSSCHKPSILECQSDLGYTLGVVAQTFVTSDPAFRGSLTDVEVSFESIRLMYFGQKFLRCWRWLFGAFLPALKASGRSFQPEVVHMDKNDSDTASFVSIPEGEEEEEAEAEADADAPRCQADLESSPRTQFSQETRQRANSAGLLSEANCIGSTAPPSETAPAASASCTYGLPSAAPEGEGEQEAAWAAATEASRRPLLSQAEEGVELPEFPGLLRVSVRIEKSTIMLPLHVSGSPTVPYISVEADRFQISNAPFCDRSLGLMDATFVDCSNVRWVTDSGYKILGPVEMEFRIDMSLEVPRLPPVPMQVLWRIRRTQLALTSRYLALLRAAFARNIAGVDPDVPQPSVLPSKIPPGSTPIWLHCCFIWEQLHLSMQDEGADGQGREFAALLSERLKVDIAKHTGPRVEINFGFAAPTLRRAGLGPPLDSLLQIPASEGGGELRGAPAPTAPGPGLAGAGLEYLSAEGHSSTGSLGRASAAAAAAAALPSPRPPHQSAGLSGLYVSDASRGTRLDMRFERPQVLLVLPCFNRVWAWMLPEKPWFPEDPPAGDAPPVADDAPNDEFNVSVDLQQASVVLPEDSQSDAARVLLVRTTLEFRRKASAAESRWGVSLRSIDVFSCHSLQAALDLDGRSAPGLAPGAAHALTEEQAEKPLSLKLTILNITRQVPSRQSIRAVRLDLSPAVLRVSDRDLQLVLACAQVLAGKGEAPADAPPANQEEPEQEPESSEGLTDDDMTCYLPSIRAILVSERSRDLKIPFLDARITECYLGKKSQRDKVSHSASAMLKASFFNTVAATWEPLLEVWQAESAEESPPYQFQLRVQTSKAEPPCGQEVILESAHTLVLNCTDMFFHALFTHHTNWLGLLRAEASHAQDVPQSPDAGESSSQFAPFSVRNTTGLEIQVRLPTRSEMLVRVRSGRERRLKELQLELDSGSYGQSTRKKVGILVGPTNGEEPPPPFLEVLEVPLGRVGEYVFPLHQHRSRMAQRNSMKRRALSADSLRQGRLAQRPGEQDQGARPSKDQEEKQLPMPYLVCRVDTIAAHRVLCVESPILITNQLSVAMLFTVNGLQLEPLRPGSTAAVPVSACEGRMTGCPASGNFGWSREEFKFEWLSDSPSRICEMRCKPGAAGSAGGVSPGLSPSPGTFCFCADFQREQIANSRPVASQYTIRLRAPITLASTLPVPIAFKIERAQGRASARAQKQIIEEGQIAIGGSVQVCTAAWGQVGYELSLAACGTDWWSEPVKVSPGKAALPKQLPVRVPADARGAHCTRLLLVFTSAPGEPLQLVVHAPAWIVDNTRLDCLEFAYSPQAAASSNRRGISLKRFLQVLPVPVLPAAEEAPKVLLLDREEASIAFRVQGNTSEPVHLTGLGDRGVSVEGAAGTSQRFHLAVRLTAKSSSHGLTMKVLDVSPGYMVVNETGHELWVRQAIPGGRLTVHQNEHHLQPQERRAFHWASASEKNLEVKILEGDWSWSGRLVVSSVGECPFQNFREWPSLEFVNLRYEVRNVEATCFVIFRRDSLRLAEHRIENYTSQTLCFRQHKIDMPHLDVPPGTSTPFAWYQPSNAFTKKLEIHCQGASKLGTNLDFFYKQEMAWKSVLVVGMQGPIQYMIRKSGPTTVLVLRDDPAVVAASDGQTQTGLVATRRAPPHLRVTVRLAGIGVSVVAPLAGAAAGGGAGAQRSAPRKVGGLRSELAFALIKDLFVTYARSDAYEDVRMKLQELQVADQRESAPFPVVLSRTPGFRRHTPREAAAAAAGRAATNVDNPLIDLHVQRCKDPELLYFDHFELKVKSMDVQLDGGFLLDVHDAWQRFWRAAGGGESAASSELPTADPMQVDVSQEGYKLHFKTFNLDTTSFGLTFSSGSGLQHLGGFWSRLLAAVAAVENAQIKLEGLRLEERTMPLASLQTRIYDHYKDTLLKKLIFKGIGSLELIGNPRGALDHCATGCWNVYYEPFQGAKTSLEDMLEGFLRGTGSCVKNTFFGAFNCVSKLTGSVSRSGSACLNGGASPASAVQPRNPAEGLRLGAVTFARAVREGAGSLASTPAHGLRVGGPRGLALGLGRGLADCMMKPVIGCCDCARLSADGMRNAAISWDEQRAQRSRLPRMLYGAERIMRPYSLQDAQLKELLVSLDAVHTAHHLGTSALVDKVWDAERKTVVIVSDTLLLHVNREQRKVLLHVPLQDITEVEPSTQGQAVLLHLKPSLVAPPPVQLLVTDSAMWRSVARMLSEALNAL